MSVSKLMIIPPDIAIRHCCIRKKKIPIELTIPTTNEISIGIYTFIRRKRLDFQTRWTFSGQNCCFFASSTDFL